VIDSKLPFLIVEDGVAYCDIVDHLLVSSFQQLAVAGAAAHPAATAGAAAVAAAAAPAALQLRSFSTDIIRSPALLRALPAAALTRLDLQHSGCWRSDLDLNSSSITAALAQLGGLRSLSLVGSVGPACVAAVGQLAQLTHLNIDHVGHHTAGSCNLQLLPLQLQELSLIVKIEGSTPEVALAHITALRHLNLRLDCSAAAGSSLPNSLTALTLAVDRKSDTADSLQRLGVLDLQQLRKLHVNSPLRQPELLTALSALTMLQLSYEDRLTAAHAAPSWQRLSALHTLNLGGAGSILKPADSLALLQGLAAATSLKVLSITGDEYTSVQLCAPVAQLTQLQAVSLACTCTTQADVLELTALTNLTKLCMYAVAAVGDSEASALALRLKGLQELSISHCGLLSAVALPAIATLTRLTTLKLTSSHSQGQYSSLPLEQEDLRLLTSLTCLKTLDFDGFFYPADVWELWDRTKGEWLHQQP
jgi:hypothetical protein